MDVSIVIIAHKDSEYLDECILSAKNQKFNGTYQIVLSSDGDPSLKKYADKYDLKFVLTEKNQSTSCSKNVNNGVLNSDGEYIKILPYDDWLPKNSLQILFDKIKKENCSLVYANAYDVKEERYVENKSKQVGTINDLLFKNVIHGGTTIFSRKDFLEVGGFDENLIYAEEYDFHLKLMDRRKKLIYIDEFVFFYRRHENQKGTNGLTPKEKEEKKILVDEIKRKFKQDLVVAGIATVEYRKNVLKQTIDSILTQVDKIYVYQNGYKELMDFLNDPKIEVISSVDTGIDMGDAGKFYMLDKINNAYFLTMDDDIIYPADYVENIISNLKKYNNNVIVSHHGRKLKPNATSYYDDVEQGFRCLDEIKEEITIDFGGTGVMGLHTNNVKELKFEYFKSPNMADIWVGKFAKENKIPIIILPHKKNWIKTSISPKDTNTIYKKYKFNHEPQNQVIKQMNLINKIKVVFLTCTWQRPEITNIFVNSLLKTQKKLESIFDFTNIVIDSEETNKNIFTNHLDKFVYLMHDNKPISNKWNFGANNLKTFDFDYVVFIGSDDIIDFNTLLHYGYFMRNQNDFIGILDMYVYDQKTSNIYYWDGYKPITGRQGETIGLGRCFSKKMMKKLNFTPWDFNINKGLDKTLNIKISKLSDIKKSNFKLVDINGFACDIKSNVNITKLTDFKDLIKIDERLLKKSNFTFFSELNVVKNDDVTVDDVIKKEHEIMEDFTTYKDSVIPQEPPIFKDDSKYKNIVFENLNQVKKINYNKVNDIFTKNNNQTIKKDVKINDKNKPQKTNSEILDKITKKNKR